MDERIAVLLGKLHGVFARLVVHVAIEHDLGSVAFGALDLDERRRRGHDNDGTRPGARGGKCHALRMVARARGDDTALQLFGRERADLIVGAAHLVGACTLHVLGLEEHAVARCLAKMRALNELGLLRDFLDLLGGLLEGVEREHLRHRRFLLWHHC